MDEVPLGAGFRGDGDDDDDDDSNADARSVDRMPQPQPMNVSSGDDVPTPLQARACRCTDVAFFMLTFVAFSVLFVAVQLCRIPPLAWTFFAVAPVVMVLVLSRVLYSTPSRQVLIAIYLAFAISGAAVMSLVTCAVVDGVDRHPAPATAPTAPTPATFVPTLSSNATYNASVHSVDVAFNANATSANVNVNATARR